MDIHGLSVCGRSTHIVYVEQQQLYAMRCTAVAPVEAGSQEAASWNSAATDRDWAADGESVAADIEALNYHRRDAITVRSVQRLDVKVQWWS